MQALDELVARWRKNPDPESTLALCAHLGRSPQSALLREVANTAEAWHRDNPSVMLSVGRMYLVAGLLAEAQASFVQAGKLAPTDNLPYRFLGEVLLRRGDAVRAEKALSRAVKLGAQDPDTRLWQERAVLYTGLQQHKGLAAVADQVARTAPLDRSALAQDAAAPDSDLADFREPAPTPVRAARRSRPPLGTGPVRPSGPRRSAPPGAPRRRGSVPPPAGAPVLASAKSVRQETLLMGNSAPPVPQLDPPVHPPSPFFPSESHSPKARGSLPFGAPRPAQARNVQRSLDARKSPPVPPPLEPEPQLAAVPQPLVDTRAEPPALPWPEPRQVSDSFPDTFPDEGPPGSVTLTETHSGMTSAVAATAPRAAMVEGGSQWLARPAAASDGTLDERELSPEAVLEALARVGLYEPAGGVTPAWETPAAPAPRRLWVLGAAIATAAALGLGGYQYARRLQSERVARAQELAAHVTGLLAGASVRDLQSTDTEFQRLFELDSRSRDAAVLWLRNRALQTLVADEPAPGIESAVERARTVGIDEVELVFGRVASALAAGDLPGATQLIAGWDERAKGQALFQLFAGAVFERAGNPESLQRFQQAAALEPDLKLAHLLAAHLAILQLGPDQAKPTVELASAHVGAGPALQVLEGLAWASAPAGRVAAPEPPKPESLNDLPPFLRATAAAVEAVRAQREQHFDQVDPAFQRALGPATAPAMAAWIGYQAVQAGDIAVARTAVLRAVELSTPRDDSKALAARIALADGRLADAQAAARTLAPSSRDAISIELVTAYEDLQTADTAKLSAKLVSDGADRGTLDALRSSSKVILGQLRNKGNLLTELSADAQVWGPLVALDLALDSGQLDFAEKLLASHDKGAQQPSYALRAARLQRYRGKTDAGLALVAPLLQSKHPSLRAGVEAVIEFVEAGRSTAAQSTLDQFADQAGDFMPWLNALVEGSHGRASGVSKQLAKLTLPGKNEPVLLQTLALRSLSAVKDRRAKSYYAELARRFPGNPEVRAAGQALGLAD